MNSFHMIRTHTLGFPRIGAQRELKVALERHWRGEIDAQALEATGRELRARHWALQRDAGLDFVAVGDFAFYDHVANHMQMFGCEPARFGFSGDEPELARYFTMARGVAAEHGHDDGCGCGQANGGATPALEMTKWFDTNYHYLVPELGPENAFRLASRRLLDEVAEAQALGHAVKPVLLGPLTFLWLGKTRHEGFDRLDLLDRLLPVYVELLSRLAEAGVGWVQLDEPILGLDLPGPWALAFERAYHALKAAQLSILLATYFSPLEDHLALACKLPVAGLHVDAVRAGHELRAVLDWLPPQRELSIGIVDGPQRLARRPRPRPVAPAACSRAARRPALDRAVVFAAAPAAEPCRRRRTRPRDAQLAGGRDRKARRAEGAEERVVRRRKRGPRGALQRARSDRCPRRQPAREEARGRPAHRRAPGRHRPPAQCLRAAPEASACAPAPARLSDDDDRLVPADRDDPRGTCRLQRGALAPADYQQAMCAEIAHAVQVQEAIGLDVLVHGEAERNDMVEYFGEQLEGFVFTANGWVQSYGSRCVKPPILFGDVARPRAMTVDWTVYAQSLTRRPMKGMLTGPITILQWSFVRDDQKRSDTALQIALAIRDEVVDLERAGIGIIQIDEPAIREGLPLRRAEWRAYLQWAARAFRVAASGVADATQIHTHMCYAEFNDILPEIAAMDADVITIETSRSAWSCCAASATSATRTRSARVSTTSTRRACRHATRCCG
jgi:5-methyltetrahydropteroyltriglutamate--homocysteine methyltransferase